ncbi:hypothetical protein MP638_006899 [Amoeboaphelidium occidentale]|nr:hypothetical protein MP638_006899 [Amoeboaphelidium occidentale]
MKSNSLVRPIHVAFAFMAAGIFTLILTFIIWTSDSVESFIDYSDSDQRFEPLEFDLDTFRLKSGEKIVGTAVISSQEYKSNNDIEECSFFTRRQFESNSDYVPNMILSIKAKGGCFKLQNIRTDYFILDSGAKLLYQQNVNDQPELVYHHYLRDVQWDKDEMHLITFKTFLITHNLLRSKMILWLDRNDYLKLLLGTSASSYFFKENHPYIELRPFLYAQEIYDTPLASSEYFSDPKSFTRMPEHVHREVVKLLILHNYGGIWIDRNMIFYRDLWDITMGVGYQFAVTKDINMVMTYRKSPASMQLLVRLSDHGGSNTTRAVINDYIDNVQWNNFNQKEDQPQDFIFKYPKSWFIPNISKPTNALMNAGIPILLTDLINLASICEDSKLNKSSWWLFDLSEDYKNPVTRVLIQLLLTETESYFKNRPRKKYTKESQELVQCSEKP